MSLSLLLLTLFCGLLKRGFSSPILTTTSAAVTSTPDILPSCPPNSSELRSLYDIIRGCITTVIACAWISVHPNIPSPNDSSQNIFFRRLKLMFWGVIAPELIVIWAVRQWIGAKEILKRRKQDKKWTITHAHFLQMGGYVLYQGTVPSKVLSVTELLSRHNAATIRWPSVSAGEITRLSAKDGLAKFLIAMQTLWFIVQCISRWVEGYVVTELELVTLALASLNGVMMVCWFRKPLDVRVAFRVQDLIVQDDNGIEGLEETPPDFQWDNWQDIKQLLSDSLSTIRSTFANLSPSKSNPFTFIRRLPNRTFHTISSMVEQSTVPTNKLRVPTFYADTTVDKLIHSINFFLFLLGSLFGAVHLAAWSSSFPSQAEKTYWRVASLIIVSMPCVAWFLLLLGSVKKQSVWFLLTAILQVLGIYLLPFVYVLARISLIVLAFLQLRSLEDSAFRVVSWNRFIPHV